jgi:hypothetical protein
MARSIGFVTALGAGAILLLLALAEPQAFAVEDTDDSGGGAKASKSCPSGQEARLCQDELRNWASVEPRGLPQRQLGFSDR